MANGQKTGGREKGTPNKITKELRDTIKEVLESEFKILPKLLESLEPEKRLSLIIKLLPYAVPRLETILYEDMKNDNTIYLNFE